MVILTGVAFPAVIVTVASRVEAVLLGSTAMVNWPAVLSVTLHHVSSELALHEVWLVVTEITVVPPLATTLIGCAGETVSTDCSFTSFSFSSGTSTPGSLLQEKHSVKSNITIVIKRSVFIGFDFFDHDIKSII